MKVKQEQETLEKKCYIFIFFFLYFLLFVYYKKATYEVGKDSIFKNEEKKYIAIGKNSKN